ncbi:alkaline phosphatase family protein [Carbonactinospora thermoautotrophica]|uniref:alkaline phosphatase family protein n=1 Tax=Carbonactinospora thermoautotrophica TaxID=1469144 RepID=UPI00227217A3|nr:nucleotide pyrophosphatase/phosphodiesterase family protein [Carbonactinospora thermoautotrophica]
MSGVPAVAPPRYGEAALADLTPSLLAALGVPGEPNPLGLAPVTKVCLLLIDGLGYELLRDHPDRAPYLCSLLDTGRVLTAGFPATTAVSLASVGTGLPPGEHGLVGYTVAIPDTGRLMHQLRWDPDVDPEVWQPNETVYARARAAGVAASHVGPTLFRQSGLTRATLRGARYQGADTVGERIMRTVELLEADEPCLVHAYYPDLDATGHRNGVGSEAWRLQLEHVDRLVEQLAARLPRGAVLYVTADHGMVDVPEETRIDVDASPELTDGVALLGGEARARHVYVRDGAAEDVLAAWRELLAGKAWVLGREEAIATGWFGPKVADWVRPRIGDVVVAACGQTALITREREPRESLLIGMHGSMTPAELLVPLLEVRV